MKKLAFALSLVLSCFASAQTTSLTPTYLKRCTVAQLNANTCIGTPPSTSGPAVLVEVTDGSSNSDCTVGGGSTANSCRWNPVTQVWADYAPGGTGVGGAVDSVFTRTGDVVAATSDYDAVQVDNTPAGSIAATNVQAALDELDAEKQPLDGDLSSIAALATTAFGRGLLTETDASTTRTTLGLVIGTNVQAFSQELLDLVNNCIIENDATPIPDSCVGDGFDGGGGSFTDIDTDYGNETIATAAWTIQTAWAFSGGTLNFDGATEGTLRVATSTTPPSCTVGDVYLDIDADTNGSLLICIATDTWKDVDDDGGAGGFVSFNAAGDSGTPQVISDSDTLTIAGGSGIATVAGATDTVTISTASTESGFLTDSGVGPITCGAAAQGKAAVLDNGTLTYCDGAATSVVQYAALADSSGVALTSLALNANAANCSAGSYALGVDAAGAAEGCTDATTEIDAVVATKSAATSTDNAIARFDGGGGDIQDSGVTIDDNGVISTPDQTAEPGNLLGIRDNDTAFTNDPTCANSGTAGEFTLIDSDETAADQWDACDGLSLKFRFPTTSTTTTNALFATATAGVYTLRNLVDGDIPDTITISLAATATALASDPTDCSANQFANAIAANGNLTCAALVDADIPDTITASNYLPLSGGTVTGTINLDGGTEGNLRFPTSTTLPGTCTVGDSYIDIDADTDGTLFICIATNTWKDIDDDGGAGGFTSFTAAGDSGTPQTITDGNTLTIAGGSGIATSAGSTDTVTVSTASGDADFLASGALTCGASTQGKAQVHTTPLQYCDNAATPTLQYAAYANSSGVALTSLALNANGGNCAAGEYPAGVDASGAVESCTDATTEINAVVADYLPLAGGTVTGTINLDGGTEGNLRMPTSTALPGTCTVGDTYIDIDADTDGTLFICIATNSWKDVDDDGGAGGFSSFTLAGTGGTPQTITDGNTATIAQGLGLLTTAGATDTVTVAINYGLTLAGDPALNADECVFTVDGAAGGGFLCEGSTADTSEQKYTFPDVNGADTSDEIATIAATQTLTNKTLDAQGTGNELRRDVEIVFPNTAWELDATNPPAETTTGSTFPRTVLSFADAADDIVHLEGHLPTSYDDTQDPVLAVWWTTSVTTGDACWCLAIAHNGDASPSDPIVEQTVCATDVADATAGDYIRTPITVNSATLAADNALVMNLYRDVDGGGCGGAADDDLGAAALFHKAILTYEVRE